jgi:hypothetical protein
MTLDPARRGMTLFVGLIVGLVAASALLLPRTAISLVALIAPLLVLPVLGLAWAMSPCGVAVDTDELRVERRAWPAMRIPLSTVASVSLIDSPARGAVRLFGVGGFFGSYGVFTSGAIGRFRMYATRDGAAVILRRTAGELPIALTPDDAAATVNAINTALGT